jgi:hypothetical protein
MRPSTLAYPCLVMRTSPLVGTKVWFGPRRLGWGLGPVSPEGWLVTGLFVAAASSARRRGLRGRRPTLALLVPFLVVAVLKGTSPGGPRARRIFEAARRR